MAQALRAAYSFMSLSSHDGPALSSRCSKFGANLANRWRPDARALMNGSEVLYDIVLPGGR